MLKNQNNMDIFEELANKIKARKTRLFSSLKKDYFFNIKMIKLSTPKLFRI